MVFWWMVLCCMGVCAMVSGEGGKGRDVDVGRGFRTRVGNADVSE